MSILSRALEAIHFTKHNSINLAEPEQALHEAEAEFKATIVSEFEKLHERVTELEAKISPVVAVEDEHAGDAPAVVEQVAGANNVMPAPIDLISIPTFHP